MNKLIATVFGLSLLGFLVLGGDSRSTAVDGAIIDSVSLESLAHCGNCGKDGKDEDHDHDGDDEKSLV